MGEEKTGAEADAVEEAEVKMRTKGMVRAGRRWG